jgi:hypothetical protein
MSDPRIVTNEKLGIVKAKCCAHSQIRFFLRYRHASLDAIRQPGECGAGGGLGHLISRDLTIAHPFVGPGELPYGPLDRILRWMKVDPHTPVPCWPADAADPFWAPPRRTSAGKDYEFPRAPNSVPPSVRSLSGRAAHELRGDCAIGSPANARIAQGTTCKSRASCVLRRRWSDPLLPAQTQEDV